MVMKVAMRQLLSACVRVKLFTYVMAKDPELLQK
jgi:hypothetical protein